MNIEDAIAKLERAKTVFESNVGQVELIIARDLKTDVQDRIQEEGIKGAEYSDSYKRYKRKRGRQTKNVDLTFSGRMWRQIDFKQTEKQGKGESSIIVGPTTPYANELVDKNTKKYGDFLTPTEEELNIAQENLIFEINDLLKRAIQ